MQRSLPFLVHKNKASFLLLLFFSCFTCGSSWGRSGKRHGVGGVGQKGGRGRERVCWKGGRCVLQRGSSCQGDYNGCHLSDQKGGKHCVKDEFPQLWRAANNITTHTHTATLLPLLLSLSTGREQQKSLKELSQIGCPQARCCRHGGGLPGQNTDKGHLSSSKDFYPAHFLLLHGNYSL